MKSISYQNELYLPLKSVSELLGKSIRWMQKKVKRGDFPVKYFNTNHELLNSHKNKMKKGYILLSSLPIEVQMKYWETQKIELIKEASCLDIDVSILNKYPLKVVENTLDRLNLVQQVIKISTKERKKLAELDGTPYPTLKNWIKNFRKKGVEGLIDKRSLRKKIIYQNDNCKAVIYSLFADPAKLSKRQAYNTYCSLQEEMGLPRMSYTTFRDAIKSIPQGAIDYGREGKEFVQKNDIPGILRDLNDLQVMECWMGDATTLDVFCVHPKFKNPVRPAITTWMDVRSRYIVGYAIAPTISTNTVTLAFRDSALKFGLPEAVYIDNGKEYKNKNWCGQQISCGALDVHQVKGRWEKLGIRVVYAWPYNPQSKSQLERWFSTLSHSFLNILPGYSGANIDAKTLSRDKERLKNDIKQGKIIPFDELTQIVGDAIESYNHKSHGALEKKSPVQIFQDGYAEPRMIRERELDWCLMKREHVKISRNGITVNKIVYGSYERKYVQNIGRGGVVYYDSRMQNQVYLYVLTNGKEEYLLALEPRQRIGFLASEDELKEAIKQKRKAMKDFAEMHKALKIKGMDVAQLARKAHFAIDEERNKEFWRTVSERQAKGAVVKFIPGIPKDIKSDKKIKEEQMRPMPSDDSSAAIDLYYRAIMMRKERQDG